MPDSIDVETRSGAFLRGVFDGVHTLRGADSDAASPPPTPVWYYLGWTLGWLVKLVVVLALAFNAPGAIGLV